MPSVKSKGGREAYAMNPGVAKAKAAAMDTEPDGDEGPLENMSIEPAANGVTVSSRHASKPGKKGAPSEYQEPKKHVFSDPGQAIGHVAKKLKKHFAGKK